METSIFLAKYLGIFLVIVGIALLKHRDHLRQAVGWVAKNPTIVVISGVVNLAVAIPLLLVHNVWRSDWTVLITIIAWLVLLKAFVRLFYPELLVKWAQSAINANWFKPLVFVFILLGAYLAYQGFTYTA
jgi:uncharacterized membrane protein